MARKTADRYAPCVHCGRGPGYRTAGLCNRCYNSWDIRRHYQTAGASRSYIGQTAPRSRPQFPTAARPGTCEKVEVLAARAAAGVDLWHPGDAVMDPELAGMCVLAVSTRSRRRMALLLSWR